MKYVTFNIRTEALCDGVNRFYFRRGLILDRIEKEQPDIIGFQELKHDMFLYMREHLDALGYALEGCGRGADYMGEHNSIAFKTDKYELIGLDVSWLSDTPHEPGSRYEIQSVCPRIITHAILRPIGEGEPFHVYNTHLDHQEAFARVKGARRVMEKLIADQTIYPFPVILSGDFNAYPDSEETRHISEHPFGLTEITRGIGNTWHNWGKCDDPQIDYIFTRGIRATSDVVKWSEDLNGVYLSDHYPLAVELEREDGKTL